MIKDDVKIAVVGLGYVGLPLALEFGKKFFTTGYDISEDKIVSYRNALDPSGEVDKDAFSRAKYLSFSNFQEDIRDFDFYIITVPTPVDDAHVPDLTPLKDSSETIGVNLKVGSVVIYESTVYPGVTEDFCIPILEEKSGLKYGVDFFVGYSPERINPGDIEKSLTNVVKVVSAGDSKTLQIISDLYKKIVPVGVYEATSIKVAEAAKVMENTQRDLNIALVNELALICHQLDINTKDVLDAASTKWNFLNFKPGLVGGHCIGVDPYYLTYCAEKNGYHPQVVLAGRKVNDFIPQFIVDKCIKYLTKSGKAFSDINVAILGLTFKENCADFRNSKTIEIYERLSEYGVKVHACDPYFIKEKSPSLVGVNFYDWNDLPSLDMLIFAVPHNLFVRMGVNEICKKLNDSAVFVDIKSVFNVNDVPQKISYWSL